MFLPTNEPSMIEPNQQMESDKVGANGEEFHESAVGRNGRDVRGISLCRATARIVTALANTQ